MNSVINSGPSSSPLVFNGKLSNIIVRRSQNVSIKASSVGLMSIITTGAIRYTVPRRSFTILGGTICNASQGLKRKERKDGPSVQDNLCNGLCRTRGRWGAVSFRKLFRSTGGHGYILPGARIHFGSGTLTFSFGHGYIFSNVLGRGLLWFVVIYLLILCPLFQCSDKLVPA